MVQIVDASVAIKWFVEEPGRDAALGVLEDVLKAPARFGVPELFYFELAHVFHRLVPHPSKEQVELLGMLTTIGIQRFSLTPNLLQEIRHFQAMGLSGYDAAYVGLARLAKGKWLTFDKKAAALVVPLKIVEVLGSRV